MADFLKDVPDSSPEREDFIEDLNDHLDDDSDQKPEGKGADPGDGDGDEDGKDGGRTIENVYRELSRKQSKLEERLVDMLAENQRLLAESITGRSREPERKTGNTLDDMSVSELETFRAQVAENNPDRLAEYDAYLNQRRVDHRVNERIQQFETKSQLEARRREANQVAVDRYPELGRRNSEFWRAVNSRLEELGESYVHTNPRAVLDAANDVAAERGVTPNTVRQRVRGSVGSRRSGGGAPVGNDGQEKSLNLPKSAKTEASRAKIASRLQHALPKGKTFDDAKMSKTMETYQKNINYYMRG